MNLHRALKHEWSDTLVIKRNGWQRLAAATSGIITPGNVVSVGGAVLVFGGLYLLTIESYVAGISLIALGRLADLADGYIANITRTKSPIGEAVDASIDKAEAFVAIIVLTLMAILPWSVFVLFMLHTIFGGSIFILAKRRNGRVHPSREGKLATAFEWLILAGFIMAAATAGRAYHFAYGISIAAVIIFTVFAIVSGREYVQEYRKLGSTHG